MRDAWGKPVDRPRDFDLYPSFLKARNEADEGRYLDDRTWQDSNLDLVFAHLERAIVERNEVHVNGIAPRIPELRIALSAGPVVSLVEITFGPLTSLL